MALKCENPSREGQGLSENYENDTTKRSTHEVETVPADWVLVRHAAPAAGAQGAESNEFPRLPSHNDPKNVARNPKNSGFEHIADALNGILAEILVTATGGLHGEVKPCQRWASRQLDLGNGREGAR